MPTASAAHELYTSLTRLKQGLTHGSVPAMTPIPPAVTNVIDPTFTPGMGALEEDPVRGLRCPVRKCGNYFHSLSRHLNTDHRAIGGRRAILEALSIPLRVSLLSEAAREKMSHAQKKVYRSGKRPLVARRRPQTVEEWQESNSRRNSEQRTVGVRNLRNSCEAQLWQYMQGVIDRTGALPSDEDFDAAFGWSGFTDAYTAFGSYDSMIAQIRLLAEPHKCDVETVIQSFKPWLEHFGCLPSAQELRVNLEGARGGDGSWPHALPKLHAVIDILHCDTWDAAQQIILGSPSIFVGKSGAWIQVRDDEWHRQQTDFTARGRRCRGGAAKAPPAESMRLPFAGELPRAVLVDWDEVRGEWVIRTGWDQGWRFRGTTAEVVREVWKRHVVKPSEERMLRT